MSKRREEKRRPEARGAAEKRLLQLLAKRGFQILKKEVRIPSEDLRHGPRFDFLVRRGSKQFAVEVKAAQGIADWFFHWLARSILVLQAVRRLEGLEPLLAVYLDHLEPRAARRFRAQAHVYAPELWWILADAKGSVVSHLPDGDEEHVQSPLGQGRVRLGSRVGLVSMDLTSYRASRAASRLSFGDLDQWLIKVLFFAPSQAQIWGGPRGQIKNVLQLAKLAQVSPPLVYRWALAMELSGYLHRWPRGAPGLQNPDGLLAEWRGRYRLNDNEQIPCRPIFGQRVDEPYVQEFLGLLQKIDGSSQNYAISGHQACRFYRARHSAARSIHLYVQDDPAVLMEALQLAPDRGPAAPIVLLKPKHQRSIFRGAARTEGVMVCDALQVYLDLYHLPDRGREQADFLYDRILEPLLRTAGEAADAL
ncbi:MAG: hypothetical protein ACREKF_09830 [Candidatus Methylomirabilales bacterium]